MPRILGLDYGDRRLGFALSDFSEIIATPLRVETCESEKQALKCIVSVCKETEAVKLVVGMPLNMDGTKGPRAEKTEAVVEGLRKRLEIPIETWDERLSTREAERVMIDAGASRAKRKKSIDKLAAQILLQNYLDAQAMRREFNDHESRTC